MDPRAAELIRALALRPHPEGGHFCEVFRSTHTVAPQDDRAARPALTAIYYLLTQGEHSRWHRVRSDEAWHFYEGAPLELFWVEPSGMIRQAMLASGRPDAAPVCVVPAGCWQAARTTGAFTLTGCTVGPGFDYEDFEIATEGTRAAEWLRSRPGLPADLF